MTPEQGSFEKEPIANSEVLVDNDGLDAIREKIEVVKKSKKKMKFLQNAILGWNDTVSADNEAIASCDRIIKTETASAMKEIDQQFDLLDEEILKAGKITSPSGTVYEAKKVIKKIAWVRRDALMGKDPDLNSITRALNLRDRVTKLVNLILDLKR